MFAFPWAFLLFLPWGWCCWRMLRRARTPGAVFASASTRFGAQRPTWRQWACRLLPWVACLGLASLIIGAAGPRTQLAREVQSADALAVMMAVDISGSMRALDLSEGRNDATRLDVVKRLFQQFVEVREEDLIGLVTFGGYASVRSPLTADHRALLHTLSGVEIPGENDDRFATEDELMTAIGDGLSVCLLRLKDAEPKTKVVILLSDGESNAGAVTPTEAAEAAKALGVRVYTIGAGSTGIAKVRATDRFGNTGLFDVQTVLDETTLREIAQTTGGIYANCRSPQQLADFLRRISELETTRVERRIFARYRSHARPWLLGGLLALGASAFALTILIRRPL